MSMQKWVRTLVNASRKTWMELGCHVWPPYHHPASQPIGRQRDGSPDEGAEGGGSQAHVALDAQEADEEGGDALHQPQVVELLGVLGVDLLEAQRGQSAFLRGLGLRGDLLPVLEAARPRLGTGDAHKQSFSPEADWCTTPPLSPEENCPHMSFISITKLLLEFMATSQMLLSSHIYIITTCRVKIGINCSN